MVTIISKNDIGFDKDVKTIDQKGSSISEIDKILTIIEKIQGLLSNPIIQQFLNSILIKFFPAGYDLYGNPLNYQQLQEQREELSNEKLFKKIIQGLEVLISSIGEDITLKELRDYLINNEEKVKEILRGFL